MTSELLPCPFCGANCRIVWVTRLRRAVSCDGCAIESAWSEDGAALITSWNRRAQPQRVGEIDEAMIQRGMDGAWNWTKAQVDYVGLADEDWRACPDLEAVSELHGVVKAALEEALQVKPS